jgi:hypothetical protein
LKRADKHLACWEGSCLTSRFGKEQSYHGKSP